MIVTGEVSQKSYDLVVAGAGPAGMAAAIVASLDGLRVLVVEKGEQVGGTAATSAGSLWVPGNTQSKRAGYCDTQDKAKKYLENLIGGADCEWASKCDVYLEMAPLVVDYFENNSELKFAPCGKHPDYRSDLEGHAVCGRAIIPQPFDGRLLKGNFSKLRPPIPEFMILGGMMIGKSDIPHLVNRKRSFKSFAHTAKLVTRYFIDRVKYPRGTRLVMGNALVGRMYYTLLNLGVDIWLSSKITDIQCDEENKVSGATISKEGRGIDIKISKGLVLATGGFSHSPELRKKYMASPTPPYSLGCETNNGDGLVYAENLGGEIDNKNQKGGGFWTPVSVTYDSQGKKGLFPHLSLDRAKPGLIAVNKKGKRFVDEGCSYHDFVEGMYRNPEDNIPAYLLCDSNFIKKYGIGCIPPGTVDIQNYVESGYIEEASTIEQLANKSGIDKKTLLEEVNKNNVFSFDGKDRDFLKGESELGKFNGDPENKPNPCIGEISKPPYYAVEVWPCEIGCSAGIKTNSWGQVLRENGSVVNGLYACGNDMASIFNGEYPGPGTTLGPALVFGYLAAKHAAGTLEGGIINVGEHVAVEVS